MFFDLFNSGLILLIVSRYNREVSSLEETCKWRVLMRNCKSNCILEKPTIGRARVSESERRTHSLIVLEPVLREVSKKRNEQS